MAFDRPVRFTCAACEAGPMSDLAVLQGEGREVLDRVKLRRRLAPGEALFRQGEPYAALYCVAEGLFGRRMIHESGRAMLTGLVRPGDILGICGLFGPGLHASTAEALVPSSVCVVQGSDARRLAAAEPALRERLLARCLAALAETERAVLEAATLPAMARLCKLVLGIMPPGGAAPVTADLPVSRTDLAALLGVQPESLSRLLRRAVALSLFRIDGRRVTVPDRARLAEAAEAGRCNGDVEEPR
jgi:CRP-like cAMP-binding protein